MTNEEAFAAEANRKIEAIRSQVRAVRLGHTDAIQCPYCQQFNREGFDLCCKMYLQAMVAVLDRLDFEDQAETLDRINQTIH